MRKVFTLLLIVVPLVVVAKEASSLRGSRASVNRMAKQAKLQKLDYMRDNVMVSQYVRAKLLVHVSNSSKLVLHGSVSFPYARPATKLWLERFAKQYKTACGEQLVVTSLLRTKKRRLWNASKKSVHPTGMAVDIRVPKNTQCRNYLERNLLVMEGAGFIEATREHRPPHYHVAVYPRQYWARLK